MKIEIGAALPSYFQADYPQQFELFSHFEFACGIPQLLFAITTVKENGLPNVCFHSWSCFQGAGDGCYALLSGLLQHTHTYANIQRTGEFCVNFLAKAHYDQMLDTISGNAIDADEFALGRFSREDAKTVAAPRIAESFLALECKKDRVIDLSGAGLAALVVGRVQHIAAAPDFASGIDKKYGPDGFMFNIHSPQNLHTGEPSPCEAATLAK